jgi:transglutaminase-like putative cysteine protease
MDLRTSAVLLLALLVTIAGLHVILTDAAWWFALATLCAVLLGTAALVRGLARRAAGASRRWLPPLAATVALALALTAVFVPATALLGILPTTASWDAFARLIEAANVSIARQSLPAVATPPIMFLLCLGVGAIAIVADALANALRTPALAGIPLLVLLGVPSAITIDATDPIVFVLAALSYLLLLRANASRRQSRLTLGLASIVLAGALVAPLLLPQVDPAQNINGSGFNSGVNPVLSLGENLRQDIDHPVLDYSTDSGTAQYLRLVSIENFTGTGWAPDPFRLRTGNTPEAIAAPPGLAATVATTEETTYVTVRGLTSPWLPLPYPTSSVAGLDGDWYWDSDGLAVKSPTRTAADETYRATSIVIEPTPAELAAAGTTVPAGFGRFLALPASMPKVISETATQVAGGASSNYEKALLLQDYFRSGDFTYSETAPVEQNYDGTGMTVIAAFLAARAGYCIHFASAMAVMARSLGIPSRIAIGFLPGTQLLDRVDGRTAFTVTSHNLHAWPELYFDGIGWTRFEPTASRGEVPAYADVASPNVPIPVNTAAPVPRESSSPRASSSAAPLAAEPGNLAASRANVPAPLARVGWLLLALLAVAGLILAPAAARAGVRRRRMRGLRAGTAGALTGWQEAIQSAEDLGVDVPETATPREAAELFAAASGTAPRDAIDRLRAAVERESYAGAVVAGRDGAVRTAATVLADTRAVIVGLGAAAGRPRRVRALLFPRSAWGGIRRAFGG